MESPKQHPPESKQPSGKIAGDFRRLKSDGAATVAELREFLGQMRGRNPKEVLGTVAESGLTRSILVATLGFAVLLAALTVVPYYLSDRDGPASGPAGKQSAAGAQDPAQGGQPEAAGGPALEPAGADKPSGAAKPGGEKVIDALGIGETKTAEPDKNPLENRLDHLLDKIE